MKKAIVGLVALSNIFCVYVPVSAQNLDQRLIGTWQGMRDQNGKCSFLAWRSQLNPDGTFKISFFSDAQRTKPVQSERGTWRSYDGKQELKTEGVPTAEVYAYAFLSDDTVKYVNTVKDASADCQEDYEFQEQRVK